MNEILTTFRFLEKVAQIYRARFLNPVWERYLELESDDWRALALFIGGYGTERRGASRDYSHVGAEAIRRAAGEGIQVSEPDAAKRVWAHVDSFLGGARLNHSNNPLCPIGTPYSRTWKQRKWRATTKGLSAIEFASRLQNEYETTNIVSWTRRLIADDNVSIAYQNLMGINGVAEKIAAFWLRDVANMFQLSPHSNRRLLQPIDTWVRQASRHLMNSGRGKSPTDRQIADWIIREANRASTSPEAINQGMWYLGNQVCQSSFRLKKSLNDQSYAKSLMLEHADNLEAEITITRQI